MKSWKKEAYRLGLVAVVSGAWILMVIGVKSILADAKDGERL